MNWRIERARVEAFIAGAYGETARDLQKRREVEDEPEDLVDEGRGMTC